MHFFVKTRGKSSLIEIDFETFGNQIVVIGEDAKRKGNEYFNRLVIKDGIYQFSLPQSPKMLKITVFEINEGDIPFSEKYQIKKVGFQRVKNTAPLLIDQDTKEFLEFSKKFSKNADILAPGRYRSKNKKFVINYADKIEDDSETPSRIHKLTGEIDVSKQWFKNMTVPGRNAILMHEFSHNWMDDPLDETTENVEIEKKADRNAQKIYKAIGYPSFEWMYSWLFIFDEHNDHYDRLDASDAGLRNRRY